MFVHHAPQGVNTLWYMNLQRTKRPLLRALRHARMDALGYRSVDEIAEKAKVARNTIYNWEKGFSPALEELDRVAVALDVPLSAMVDAWSGRQHETAAPLFTRRLLTGVIALERRANISPDELASAEESAIAIEAGMGVDARIASGLVTPRRTSGGRNAGRGGGRSAGSLGSTPRKP